MYRFCLVSTATETLPIDHKHQLTAPDISESLRFTRHDLSDGFIHLGVAQSKTRIRKAIVIEFENEADTKFWLNLSKKTGIKSRAIDTEKFEDVKLAALIEKGMTSKTVSRKSIMEILEQK